MQALGSSTDKAAASRRLTATIPPGLPCLAADRNHKYLTRAHPSDTMAPCGCQPGANPGISALDGPAGKASILFTVFRLQMERPGAG